MDSLYLHVLMKISAMALEALAVVSLATSVVQFVDSAVKLISKGNQYYKKADGDLEENTQLRAIVDKFG